MFSGGDRFHRKGVNLLAHSIAQGSVDPLVAAHARQAFEFSADDGGKEMLAVAFQLQVLAGQAGSDECADFFGGRVGHAGIVYERSL